MNKLNTSLPELLNMLKTVESHFKGEKASVLLIVSKKKAGNKGLNKKKKINSKASISKKKVKSISAKGIYFYYGKKGY